MKQVHVECDPDEKLVLKLGFNRKTIVHHQGKSRIFKQLEKSKDQLAIVDEDPGSNKTTYEKSLKLVDKFEGINYYTDKSANKIFVLKVKLEDWILEACNQSDIKVASFGLPNKPNDLHNVINSRLTAFSKLLDELHKKNNPAIIRLMNWLN
jgi:hypothetical protein